MPGGNTPTPFFNYIAKKQLNWSKTTILLSDERLVPTSHIKSNYRKVHINLIKKITNSPPPHFVKYNKSFDDLDEYLSTIGTPDLSILGFGEDGHTASIFPNNFKTYNNKGNLIKIKNKWEKFERLSLSFDYLLKSKKIVFLLIGLEKASALKRCLSKKYNPRNFPAQYLLKNFKNDIFIYCDSNAASLL